MADPKSDALPPEGDEQRLGFQLSMMWRAFLASPVRNVLIGLAAAMVAVVVATAIGQVVLNRWNRPFYDAIERRDVPEFFHQLVIFAQIAVVLLLLNVGQTWLNQMIRLKLREGLTRDLIGVWMEPRRAFRLANAGAIGVNPDQRLHEDARHLTDLCTDLGTGLLQATVLLVSFVSVLWSLTSGFVFHIGGSSFVIPGYMVWAAVIYAGTASWLSWLVGRPLIKLNADRYAQEAELRFSLMRVNEHIDAIALAGGEADEKRRLEVDLGAVLDATRKILWAFTRLTWVTSSYGWVSVVAPIVIASPVYFAGDISFGGLMMAVGAFNQVHASLRWFVDNISSITDWRATLLRVSAFRIGALRTDVLHQVEKRIEFFQADGQKMVFDHVRVASPGGATRLVDDHVEIMPGERVLVTGVPGAGKTLFFRVLAGLWPWGSGRIGMPQGETPTFVPRRPYLPPGTLRDVLCYPRGTEAFGQADLAQRLEEVGLSRLTGSLDRSARWERELSDDEQRMLAFARLVLHKPRWVVIDEALEAVDAETHRRMMAIWERDLAGTTIINIGRGDRNGHFFTRTVRLSRDPAGQILRPLRVATSKSVAAGGS